MVTVTLNPFAQSYDGSDMEIGASIDAPVLVGGGSVSDGSDSSYVEMGTWVDGLSVTHLEPLACDFALPSSYTNPTALAVKLRMRADPDIAADPPDLDPSAILLRLHDAGTGAFLTQTGNSNGGSVGDDIITGSMTSITDRSFWFDDIDPADPTDAGFWFEFAVDATDPAACADALTGAGIRVSIAVDAGGTLDAVPRRRPWLDIYEFQLLVSCSASGNFPLRRYPRPDGLGIGPTRHHPRTRNGVRGIR